MRVREEAGREMEEMENTGRGEKTDKTVSTGNTKSLQINTGIINSMTK